jgi:hypothetical protein
MGTPPLNTGNIGFEPPTEIGNSTWIVRVEFGPMPFQQTVPPAQNSRAILPVVTYTIRETAA